MTEANVARIEAELGVTLPVHYREFVLAYPQRLRDAKMDFGSEQRPTSDSFLFDAPRAVIDANRAVRQPGLLVTDGETGPWPDGYLIVGNDGGGNCWCIKPAGRSKAVWFFDHEEGGFSKQSKSLADHERYALESVAEFNRSEPLTPNRAPQPAPTSKRAKPSRSAAGGMGVAERKRLKAVLAAPDDDGPRLEYADWFAANGQPERAQLIRVQIELARLEEAAEPDADPTPEEDRLYERADELLAGHAWHLGMPEVSGVQWGGGPHHGFERGFMTRVHVADADTFCSRMGEVFAAAPVTEVRFDDADDEGVAAVAGSPHLARVRDLSMIYGKVGDAGAAALAASPHAARLRAVSFFASKVGPAGAAALARSPHLGGLRDLTLNSCRVGADGARAVLESHTLAGLEHVDLRGCFPTAKNKDLVAALRERFGGALEV